MEYGLGCLMSPKDNRDYLYGHILRSEVLPEAYDSEADIGPVRNQGQFGTCVAFAGVGIKDDQETKDWGQRINTSPLYIYKKCKELDGIPNEEGTYPRIAMKVLSQYGTCLESTFPYNRMAWPTMPSVPSAAETEAAKFKIGAYASISTIDEVKQAIYRSGSVMAALLICQSFVDVGSDGYIPVPGEFGTADPWLGGHGLKVCGWDNNRANGRHVGYFRIRNSWGPEWGDGGYCWVPYDYFLFKQIDMGGMPYWMESWSSVDIITPNPEAKDIVMYLNSDIAIVDGQEIQMDCAPVVDYQIGRTFVPLRFISEHFGYQVDWFQGEQKIHIYK